MVFDGLACVGFYRGCEHSFIANSRTPVAETLIRCGIRADDRAPRLSSLSRPTASLALLLILETAFAPLGLVLEAFLVIKSLLRCGPRERELAVAARRHHLVNEPQRIRVVLCLPMSVGLRMIRCIIAGRLLLAATCALLQQGLQKPRARRVHVLERGRRVRSLVRSCTQPPACSGDELNPCGSTDSILLCHPHALAPRHALADDF